MTKTESETLTAWAKSELDFEASDIQCALATFFGGNYDESNISLSDAQDACRNFATFEKAINEVFDGHH